MALKLRLSQNEIEHNLNCRWKARTDLLWLCRNVLEYKDVDDAIHGPIQRHLQQFPLPSKVIAAKFDTYTNGQFQYTPWNDAYSDLKGGRYRAIFDSRGWYKCQRENSLFSCTSGEYKNVTQLRVGERLKSLTEDFFPTETTVIAIEKQEPQPCYKITFTSGRIQEASEEHPYRSVEGWTLAKELKVGDRIALLNWCPQVKGPYLPYAEIMGWMLGDGCIPNQNVSNINEGLRDKIIAAVDRAGGTANVNPLKNGVQVQGLRPLFRDLGLLEARSGVKYIPAQFFAASDQSVKELLYGLYMSDGGLQDKGIDYTSKSEQLTRDIQRLLVRFGIRSKLYRYTISEGQAYAGNEYWRLAIYGTRYVTKFLALIPWDKPHTWVGQSLSADNCETVPKAWKKRFGKYLFWHGKKPKNLPKGSLTKYDITKEKLALYAEALNDRALKNLAAPEVCWDTVRSVEATGLAETWAVQTADSILVVDDIVTHNTTVNTISHSIQWLLNYPHLAMMLLFASGQRSEDILKAIKEHFRSNPKMRQMFPEYCPQVRIADWGTASDFTLPNRARILDELKLPPRVESSVMAQALNKGQIGYHVDIIKCSDLVEPSNVLTPAQRYQVKHQFGLAPKLLVNRPDGTSGWVDVEGTFYHPADLHVDLIKAWKDQKPDQRRWSIFIRGVYKRELGGIEPRFDPTEMDMPFAKDTDGNRIPTWPQMDPLTKLVKEEADPLEGGGVFASQRLLDIRADTSSNRPFQQGLMWKKAEDYRNVPIMYRVMSCDLADTDGLTANPSAIVVAAISRDGKTYIEDIQHGRWGPQATVDRIFATYFEYQKRGNLRSVIIEDYAYTHGLKPTIDRKLYTEGMERGIENLTLPFDFVTPDRTKKKVVRIVNALQAPYNEGELAIVDPFTYGGYQSPDTFEQVKRVLQDEFRDCTLYSTGASDDILDAIAYVFLRRNFYGKELGDTALPSEEAILRFQREQYQKAFRAMVFPGDESRGPATGGSGTGW